MQEAVYNASGQWCSKSCSNNIKPSVQNHSRVETSQQDYCEHILQDGVARIIQETMESYLDSLVVHMFACGVEGCEFISAHTVGLFKRLEGCLLPDPCPARYYSDYWF